MRTASIEVKKFSSLRAFPLIVLNKQRRRGDKDGCGQSKKNIFSLISNQMHKMRDTACNK